MILEINGWKFDIDLEETMSYAEKVLADHCQCGYCRNFYMAVDSAYPALRPFLAKFGMHVETPEELMPFEPTVSTVSYCISGQIIQRSSYPLEGGGTVFSVDTQEEMPFDTQCKSPYFVITSGFLELPWLLDEDMDEIISTANEPEFLEKMWNRLLDQNEDSLFIS